MGNICNEKKEAIIDINEISFSTLKKINLQKECVVKIIKDDKPFGTGFICKIPYNKDKDLLPVLITNNHVLNINDIKIGKQIKILLSEKDEKILKIDESRITYTSEENIYDTTIIEIKEQDNINLDYNLIEIDDNVYIKDELKKNYINKEIYMIHYPQGNEISLSYNKLTAIDSSNNKIQHKCGTKEGSSGAPIFNSRNNKLIAIHTGHNVHFFSKINIGIIITEPINEFILTKKISKNKNTIINNDKNEINNNINEIDNKSKNNNSEKDNKVELKNIANKDNEDNKDNQKIVEKGTNINHNKSDNKNKKNEIVVKINVTKNNLYKDIFFLNDDISNNKKDSKIDNQDTFVKNLNETNTNIYLNGNQIPFEKYFIPEIEGVYSIKIEFFIQITDCIGMFKNCSQIKNIDFITFNTEHANSMKNMFLGCTYLESLNLNCFNTENVTDMSCMFSGCHSLKNINLSSFNTKNVIYMNSMFSICPYLTSLNLSMFKTDKVIDMNRMFCLASRLVHIDLSSFNTENVTNMESMFEMERPWLYQNIVETFDQFESKLQNLDLTSFNTKNVKNMKRMFKKCDHLVYIKFSSDFNTENVNDMSEMFNECKAIRKLDISCFNTKNVINMKDMFKNCYNLINLNFSFNAENVTNMEGMFNSCQRLKNFNLSISKIKNVINISWMFSNCITLSQLDLSGFDTKNVQSMEGLFYGCKNLKNINLSSFITKNVTNIDSMFEGCNHLEDLNLSNFEFEKSFEANNFLKNCNNLKNIELKQSFYNKIKNQLTNSNINIEIK